MLNVDIMDDSGEHSSGYSQDVIKVRLDLSGKEIELGESVSKFLNINLIRKTRTNIFLELGDNTKDIAKALNSKNDCGSCYGATSLRQDGCCNTCQDVREAYVKSGWGMVNVHIIDQCITEGWIDRVEKQSNEGCNIYGHLLVNKVRGNFHFAPGDAFQTNSMHVHDLKEFSDGAPDGHKFDLSHNIHKLKFGPDTKDTTDTILAVTDALAGTTKNADQGKHFIYTLIYLI